jgi:putative dimethyl sulfoxide reductase chaperone
MTGNHKEEMELYELLGNRSSTYAFLSRAYKEEPSLDFLNALVRVFSTAKGGIGEDPTLTAFVQKIAGTDLASVVSALATEYAALFLNVGKIPVYPFESVYTSAERLLMQQARDDVLKEYRKAGLAQTQDFREPEDHIALELDFMSNLGSRTLASLQAQETMAAIESLRWQKDFFEKHLMVWVPKFCQDVGRAAQSDFYRGVALLTNEFLESERETIPALIDELQEGSN